MKEQETTLWPGWETVRLIGKGSFGAVYEIQRDIFGEVEKAALKVITIPQHDGDIEDMYGDGYDADSITSTFRNHMKSIVGEYSLMRKMNGCVNIVDCEDVHYEQHDDGFGWDIYIKMELLTPLLRALPEQIPENAVIKLAKDIGNALNVCKEHGIIHRDIKPQNIFVSQYGDYKLGDFGIAKTVEKTMGGTKIGTYKYMAPEVYNNQPYGSSADIYSLGLVLYWLLNERRMPFLPLPPAKLSMNQDEDARYRRLSGEPIPAPKNGSAALKAIVLKACAFDPKDRYASAAEMLEELRTLDADAAPVNSTVLASESVAAEPEDDRTIGPAFSKAQSQPTATPEPDPDATIGPVFAVRNTPQKAPETKQKEPQKLLPETGGIKKRVMAVLLLAIILAVCVLNAETFISRIITANLMISANYEAAREPIQNVNDVLLNMIGATTGAHGMIYTRDGCRLNPDYECSNFWNASYLILTSAAALLLPVIAGTINVFRKRRQTTKTRRICRAAVAVSLYLMTAEAYICRIITGNIMLGAERPDFAPVTSPINAFLTQLVHGTQAAGLIYDKWGRRLNNWIMGASVQKGLYIAILNALMLVVPVVIGAFLAVKALRKNNRRKEIKR